jgi:PIN domain
MTISTATTTLGRRASWRAPEAPLKRRLPTSSEAKWTNAILDEMFTALRRNRPDIPAEKLDVLRDRMNKAVRDCLVSGYEPLIEGLKLPDPGDRHVLAAAVKAGAQVIVTRNLKDFPPEAVEDVLSQLERDGLVESVTALRAA